MTPGGTTSDAGRGEVLFQGHLVVKLEGADVHHPHFGEDKIQKDGLLHPGVGHPRAVELLGDPQVTAVQGGQGE